MIEFPIPTNYQEFSFGQVLAGMPHVPGLAERVLRKAGQEGGEPASPYALQQHLYEITGKELHSRRGSLGGDLFALSWFILGFQGWTAFSTRFGIALPPWFPNDSYLDTLRRAVFDLGVDAPMAEMLATIDRIAAISQSKSPMESATLGVDRFAETVRYLSSAAICRGHRIPQFSVPAWSVFVSYSSKDSGWVAHLKAFLEDNAVNVWLAPFDLRSGSALDAGLDESIHSQDCLLLILTEHSLASSWVAVEVTAAIAAKKRIVPIALVSLDQVRRAELWQQLSSYPVVDCSAVVPIEAYREILRHLQKRELDLTRWAGDEGSVLGLFFP